MAFNTVNQFVESARRLVQDTVEPYRYSDEEYIEGLNLALLEARRIRPDLFIRNNGDIPYYTDNDGTEVDIDPQYRVAVLYFIVGHIHLRDEEDTQDARASVFLNKFVAKMQTVMS